MKSIELLKNIQDNYTWEEGIYYKEHFKQIEKDLELLEILREYFSYTEFGYWYIEMSQSDFDYESECTKEEWENSPQKKIEEWLKGK